MIKSPLIDDLLKLSFQEDCLFDDITAHLCLEEDDIATAEIVAKEDLVVCGLFLIEKIVKAWDLDLKCESSLKEGSSAKLGDILGVLSGNARDLMRLERTALNFLQRLSGVASYVRNTVHQIEGISVLDTRKTTPGWRLLEKHAVKTGGGRNHRFSLSDMILIKDNHIDAFPGDIQALLKKVKSEKPYYMPIEIEIRDLVQLKQALLETPNIIMLDNMDDEQVQKAVALVKESGCDAKIEVSGRITRERLEVLKTYGVDCVSMGSLTYQASAVDISMNIRSQR